MSQWLDRKGVSTLQASDWNELTQMLRRIFKDKGPADESYIAIEPKIELFTAKDVKCSQFIIVVDIGLLDLSTNIWKDQLTCLNRYADKVRFAWILNHDTSSSIKKELRRKGHFLMVNKPLYKSKMIQILEAVIKQKDLELQEKSESTSVSTTEGEMHECLEVDPIHYDASSSEDSDKVDIRCSGSRSTCQNELQIKRERMKKPSMVQLSAANNYLLEFDDEDFLESNKQHENQGEGEKNGKDSPKERKDVHFAKNTSEQKSLEGIKILLAEDTPVLQRVATIMLEKVGARVMAVGDGLQAVNALKCSLNDEGCCTTSPLHDGTASNIQTLSRNFPPFDLILMDCQVIPVLRKIPV